MPQKRGGHVCSLFDSTAKREVAPLVFARLFNQGKLAVVDKKNAIVDATTFGFLPDRTEESMNGSVVDWREVKGLTLVRTPDVVNALCQRKDRVEAEKALVAEKKSLAERERALAFERLQQRCIMASEFTNRLESTHVQLRWAATQLGCDNIWLLREWMATKPPQAGKPSCGFTSIFFDRLDSTVPTFLSSGALEEAEAAVASAAATGSLNATYAQAADRPSLVLAMKRRMARQHMLNTEVASQMGIQPHRLAEWLNGTIIPLFGSSVDDRARSFLSTPCD
ncbi:MAG: hypothetical protein SGPRY_007627 [Prymnesium sp.]